MSEHDTPIKTPKQLIITVVLAFVIPILACIALAYFVSYGLKPGAGKVETAEAVIDRIAPVATLSIAASQAAAGPKSAQDIYKTTCSACHDSGAAGAPKLGDTAAWAPRNSAGLEALLKSALNGKNAMPARGGNSALSDEEVKSTVIYMANQSGGKFPEK